MTSDRSSRAVVVLGVLLVLAALRGHAASVLEGTWQLDTRRSTLTTGMLDDRATLRQELKIGLAGDQLRVVTTTIGIGVFQDRPAITTAEYDVDGQSRSFPWGDTIPPGTVTRTARWTSSTRGLELVEVFNGVTRVTQRWTVSDADDVLTIDFVDAPPRNHRVLVYIRQPG